MSPVLKIDDVNKYCSPISRARLNASITEVQQGRLSERKSMSNDYLVINTDEPYADKIRELMEEYDGKVI